MIGLEQLRQEILAQNPTEEQREAIFSDEPEFLLRAAPGSGKTWTSSRRFIWRGANWSHDYGGLALLSFTNTAVREFKEATEKVGLRELLSEPNYLGTFDAFVERFILAPFGHLLTASNRRLHLFIAPRPGDWANTKLLAYTQLSGGRTIKVPAWEIVPYPGDNEICFRASKDYGGKDLTFGKVHPVLEFFMTGRYSHAQRVFLAERILKKFPHIGKCLARRFPEIIVDEAQDTNVWLLRLLHRLHTHGCKVTLIGDPDQCIYEFSMASASSMSKLKAAWGMSEKPLSKSFRCRDPIAEAVRNISGNAAFRGTGPILDNCHGAYIVRDSEGGFATSVKKFEELLLKANIAKDDAAIICRGNVQLEIVRGEVNYAKLEGKPKEFALAAFHRDVRHDFQKAYKIVLRMVEELTTDAGFWEIIENYPESDQAQQVKLKIWQFVRSTSGLPSINTSGEDWVAQLRVNLGTLFGNLGMTTVPQLGYTIKKTGLVGDQLTLPLFTPHKLFPPIRQETIHQVKGESIDGVLVIGSSRFFNSVVKAVKEDTSEEERRLAYVAMTRARHLLVVGLPKAHFDANESLWNSWGFKTLA